MKTCPAVKSYLGLLLALALAGCSSYPRPKPRPVPAGISFAGNWESTWGRMELMQDGQHVHGTVAAYREAALSGDLDGDVWHFIWSQRAPRQTGRGYLQISPDGQHLVGRWGYLKDDSKGGAWTADRDNY